MGKQIEIGKLDGMRLEIDNLILIEEKRLDVLRRIKLLLNSEELNSNVSMSGILEKNETKEPTDPNYPKGSKNMSKKLDYILTKAGRALHSNEFIKIIEDQEGAAAAAKAKASISSNLHKFVLDGRAVSLKFSSDKKLAFYAKPEWTTKEGDTRIVLAEHYPSNEILADVPEKKLKPEFIDWNGEFNNNLNQVA